jgi:hypothetical protein
MDSRATLDSSGEEIISYPYQDLNPGASSLMPVAIPIMLMQPPSLTQFLPKLRYSRGSGKAVTVTFVLNTQSVSRTSI